jgi:ribosomal protein S18 acetylase RimI-like enzyme
MSENKSALKELKIRFGDITKDNWQQLRKVNNAVFPVRYNDNFYKATYAPENKVLTKFAYENDVVVGAVSCRFEQPDPATIAHIINTNPTANTSNYRRVYIMTLGVLSPYRLYGIGRKLVNFIIDYAQNPANHITDITLNVQISNSDAIKFYEKFGFENAAKLENYYKRIDPPHAYVLTKKIKLNNNNENNANSENTAERK